MAASGSSSRLLAIGGVVFAVGVVLVLFLVRGGEDSPAAAPTPAATSTPTDQPSPTPTEETVEVPTGVSTRVQIPVDLELPEGTEAVAVDVSYLRSVAAFPERGDVVRLYRLPPVEPDRALVPVDRNRDGQPDLDADGQPVLAYPPVTPPAEPVGLDLEVLAVIGAHPVARGGSSTMIFGVPSPRVPEILALVNTNELWVTLLPSSEG